MINKYFCNVLFDVSIDRDFYGYFGVFRSFRDWFNFYGGLVFGEFKNNKIEVESRFII